MNGSKGEELAKRGASSLEEALRHVDAIFERTQREKEDA